MKKRFIIVTAIIVAGLSSVASAQFYSSTSDFNAMGPTGTTMPPGWSYWYIAGDGSSLVNPTSAEMATATLGSQTLLPWSPPAMTFFQQAGNEGTTPTDTTRLLGTSPTEDRGDILQLSVVNTAGAPLYGVTVSYDMSFMASGTLKDGGTPPEELPGYSFYYLDGSTWTYDASLSLSSAGSASATVNFTTPVPNGGTMQFAWYDDNANDFSPDDMYAIGNVTVVPEPAALSLFALGALALIFRRRTA